MSELLHRQPLQRGTPKLGQRFDLDSVVFDAMPPEAFEVYFVAEQDIFTFTHQLTSDPRLDYAYDSDQVRRTQFAPLSFHYHPKGSRVYSRVPLGGNVHGAITVADALTGRIGDELGFNQQNTGSQCNLNAPLAATLCQLVSHASASPQWCNSMVFESLTVMAYCSLQESLAGAGATVASGAVGRVANHRFSSVLDYIEAHLNDDLSLQTLADVACTSLFHFSRLFKQALGRSPHQYIIERRLERAKEQLATTSQPILHIALNCGFASQSHLNRLFKARYGVTPRQFRLEAIR